MQHAYTRQVWQVVFPDMELRAAILYVNRQLEEDRIQSLIYAQGEERILIP